MTNVGASKSPLVGATRATISTVWPSRACATLVSSSTLYAVAGGDAVAGPGGAGLAAGEGPGLAGCEDGAGGEGGGFASGGAVGVANDPSSPSY